MDVGEEDEEEEVGEDGEAVVRATYVPGRGRAVADEEEEDDAVGESRGRPRAAAREPSSATRDSSLRSLQSASSSTKATKAYQE